MRTVLPDEVSKGLREEGVVAAKGIIGKLLGMFGERWTSLKPCDDGWCVLWAGLHRKDAFAVLRLRVLVIGLFPATEYHKKLKLHLLHRNCKASSR